MTKVVLVEAHPLLRLGLHQMLATIPGALDVVALDPRTVAEFAYLECEVELLVFGMPADAEQGWPALFDACAKLRPRRVLILSDGCGSWKPPQDAVLPGLYGCITKTAPLEALTAAVRLGLAGGEPLPGVPPQMTANWQPVSLGSVPRKVATTPPADAPAPNAAKPAKPPGPTDLAAGAQLLNVTPRQYEVLTLLARGYPIKTVSRMLNISTATAKAHASTLYQRLRVSSKGEAVYAARLRGVVFE